MKHGGTGTASAARAAERIFRRHGVTVTMGGEPTYVPENPEGAEWSHAAVGPTKLSHARHFAEAILNLALPGGRMFFTPGKHYPGETNPRWSLQLVANHNGKPLAGSPVRSPRPVDRTRMRMFRKHVQNSLGVRLHWHQARTPSAPNTPVWVSPLDHQSGKWRSQRWTDLPANPIPLLDTDGPAGLRLPLDALPKDAMRRALTLELRDGDLHVFFPPLLQRPFLRLLRACEQAARSLRIPTPHYEGYLPPDQSGRWIRLGVAADPGVLEVNLPACREWREYARWIRTLEMAATASGLRSAKKSWTGLETGTGGGNHLLFGGWSTDDNPFFPRPGWISDIARYWQRHPALSYLFTGIYVGPSSQAPRPDESARSLEDLEMAYQTLDALPNDDQRSLINETIRHMHIDAGGNTHRTEISVDKFWTPNTPTGCLGLLEFRAVETFPKAQWMNAVALLWRAILASLLDRPLKDKSLTPHGDALHDRFFLPHFLVQDLHAILDDLHAAGIRLPKSPFHKMLDWKFPTLYQWSDGKASLRIRAALEGWPLLSEVPLDGGTTSRFVDTSMERIEITATPAFTQSFSLLVGGAPVRLLKDGANLRVAGVRYRRSALYPCLHPGLPLHMPLHVEIRKHGSRHPVAHATMPTDSHLFQNSPPKETPPRPKQKLPHPKPGTWTYDLRKSQYSTPRP